MAGPRSPLPDLENILLLVPEIHIHIWLFNPCFLIKSVAVLPSTSGIIFLKNKSHYGWIQPSPKRKRSPTGETADLTNFAFTQQRFRSPTPAHSSVPWSPGSSCPLGGLRGRTVAFGTENTPETAEQASQQENQNKLKTVVSKLVQKKKKKKCHGAHAGLDMALRGQ